MASRHNAVHFLNILTSTSAPRPSVSNLFYFQMCFAPQRRALFFSISQLPNVLGDPQFLTQFTSKFASRHNAVRFFNISTSKSAPNPQCLTHFTSKSASRHNAVHFFNISTSKSGPMVRCFVPFNSKIGFAPQRRATFHLRTRRFKRAYFSTLRSHKTTKKHSISLLSYLFAHLHLLSFDLFSSDSSPLWLLFHLSILSEVWLLNFLRWYFFKYMILYIILKYFSMIYNFNKRIKKYIYIFLKK